MQSNTCIKSGLKLALLLAASACGGSTTVELEDPGPGEAQQPTPVELPPPSEPEPLVTLVGQLVLGSSVTVDGPVRLALAWYPSLIDYQDVVRLSRPVGLVSEDVAYQGGFPANFQFRIYQPPPDAALLPVSTGSTVKGALGVLIAYQDLNGNGKLDTIPVTGAPIDRVLGTSKPWPAPGTEYMVAYLDATLESDPSYQKGFNLLRRPDPGNKLVPLSTPIPITLSAGGPLLDAVVCEGLWFEQNPPPADQCGLDFSP